MRHKLRKLPKVGCILVVVTLYSFTHNFSHHFALLAPFPTSTATDRSSNTNYYELSYSVAVIAGQEGEEAVTPPRRPHHDDDNNNTTATTRIKHYDTDITAGGVQDKNKKDNIHVAAAPSTAAAVNPPPPSSSITEEQDSMHHKNHSSSTTATSTTTTITRDVSTGRSSSYNVYACGYPDFVDKVASSIFNDAKKVQWFTEDHLGPDNHSPNDILVVSFRGPCFLHRPGRKTTTPKEFRGRVLYITGEPLPLYPLDVRDGLYALSHMPTDGKQNIRCYYGLMDLSLRASPMLQKKIFDPDKKVVNSGERFLIYANTKCKSFRESAFDSLSYVGRGPAYYGGGCNGTMDRSDTVQFDSKVNSVKWGNNHKAFSKYRFALVMENTKKHGYVTEKILNAFLAGSVPIYYGTRDVFRIFNPKAFVYYDIEDPKPALDLISYLERNETAYNDMLRNQPILKDGENTIQEYFSYSDEIGNGMLKKKIRAMMGFETHIHTHNDTR